MSDRVDLGADTGGIFPGDLAPAPQIVADAGIALEEGLALTPTPSPYRRAWKRLLRDKPAMIALAFLVALIVVAVFAPVFAPYDPNENLVGGVYETPSADHWLGTDDLGRDNLSRIIYGARVSLRSGFQIVGIALLFAIPIGLLAGFRGGGVDIFSMRVMDGISAFPPLILALAVVGMLGAGLSNAILAISIVVIPGFTRLIRAQTLAVRQEPFIEASLAMGTKPGRVRRKRVLPNVASPLIVAVSLAFGGALIAEASLSVLGFGVEAPEASWGAMINKARIALYEHPWLVFIPSGVLVVTILAFNTLGDGVRDALGLGLPKGKQAVKGKLGLTTVERAAPEPASRATGEIPSLLAVQDLSVEFVTEQGPATVVDHVSLSVAPGEVIALVGESGSGKTVTSLAVMRLVASPPGRITSGSVRLDGRELLDLSFNEMRALRGSEMAMVFQDPMTSLNPAFTVGTQLVDTIRQHTDLSRRAARGRALELLELVGIPDPQRRLKDYPHQMSGGMRQRALLALALSCEPRLLIADEPTTALDVTVQAQILDLLRSLQERLGMAVVFVTHDLGVVADLCSRVIVMYAGQVVEEAPVEELFARPRHPYTAGLLAAIPQRGVEGERLASIPGVVPPPTAMPTGCRFHPRCPYAIDACASTTVELTGAGAGHRARCIRVDELALGGTGSPGRVSDPVRAVVEGRGLVKHFPIHRGILRRTVGHVRAVDGVDLVVEEGRTLGLVGESGSGKSTVGRVLMRLYEPTAGTVVFDGTDVTTLPERRLRPLRRGMQLVYQDPFSSFDPLATIADSLAEPMRNFLDLDAAAREDRIAELLRTVSLNPDHRNRYPREFSGGQLQRIAIARALALSPKLLVLDEPVSSLDVSIQADIINLLGDLQAELGIAYLFIAHDLALVRHVSTRIAVMYLGRIVEEGPAGSVYDEPKHPYTEALLSAIPVPDPVHQRSRERIVLVGDIPSPASPPSGCRFHTRCPYAFDPCATVDPPEFSASDGTRVACHLHTDGPKLAGASVVGLRAGRAAG